MSTQTPSTTALNTAAQRSAGSFELVLGPVLMALLGLLVDGWAGTRPLFTILFTVWGAVGAAVSIYFRYRHQSAADLEARRARSAPDVPPTRSTDGGVG